MQDDSVDTARRAARYAAREVLWAVSSLPRVARCGRRRINGDQGVPVVANVEGGGAHFTNLQLCGSVHACPVCSAKIRQGRADEIQRAMVEHVDRRGGGAYMLTLTVPHHCGDRLVPLLDTVADGFSSLLAGKAWYAMRDGFGIVGTIRALEVTHGGNGWHPHLHVLVLTERPLLEAAAAALADRFFDRWARFVNRRLGTTCDRSAFDFSPVRSSADAAGYVGKFQDGLGTWRRAGLELTRHDLKTARRKGATPLQLLQDFATTGDLSLLALWHEYEAATHGRRALTWSRGLKDALGIDQVDDQELAEAEVGGAPVCVIPPATWLAACKRRGAVHALLVGASLDGRRGVESVLHAFGLDPKTADPPEPRLRGIDADQLVGI